MLADVFARLWGIRQVALARNRAEIVRRLDGVLRQPPGLTDEQRQEAQAHVQVRRERLLERLRTQDRPLQGDTTESLFRHLLRPHTD